MVVSVQELGDLVRAVREEHGLTQEALAAQIGISAVNRSNIAHLEQGVRVPNPEVLKAICEHLSIPGKYWKPLLEPEFRQIVGFEEALAELCGKKVSIRFMDEQSIATTHSEVRSFFEGGRTLRQTYDALNSLLVFYGVGRMSLDFFRRYLGVNSAKSPDSFAKGVESFQKEAIRLFSTFSEAYQVLNQPGKLDSYIDALKPRDVSSYIEREPWAKIEEIEDSRLSDLGYISVAQAKKEEGDRQILADFLKEVADQIKQAGAFFPERYTTKKRSKMSSLLRQFGSRLEHDFMSSLFSPDADALLREADSVAPKDQSDLARIGRTQEKAKRNLAQYLAADHLDVYVATSMRNDADFSSVNAFCRELFSHSDVRPLNLRYFNPTQSWIEDRVAKGLVEALMLRRADLTIYMAQKSDTFGKDSEASVALGQGKPVIVYVPRLFFDEGGIDSEAIGAMSRNDLESNISLVGTEEDKESDPTMDHDALVARLLTLKLSALTGAQITKLMRMHWADFDVYSEVVRVDEGKRSELREWLDDIVERGSSTEVPEHLFTDVVGAIVAVSTKFEQRARVFREVHPLALQIILSTGVLNGMLVVRSVDACARVVEALFKNALDFVLNKDSENYKLLEKTTGSVARVISRNPLITSAFATHYSIERIE